MVYSLYRTSLGPAGLPIVLAAAESRERYYYWCRISRLFGQGAGDRTLQSSDVRVMYAAGRKGYLGRSHRKDARENSHEGRSGVEVRRAGASRLNGRRSGSSSTRAG